MPSEHFDPRTIFVVKVPGSRIEIGLEYPKDKEWADRARLHPVTRAIEKDEMSTAPVDTSAFDLALFNRHAVEINEVGADGKKTPLVGQRPEVEAVFAKRVITALDRAVVLEDECTADGAGFTVVVEVHGGKRTVHNFKTPTAAAVENFFEASQRSTVGIKKRHLKQTTVIEPAGELYDRCIRSVEGYKTEREGGLVDLDYASVPLNHKAAAAAKLAEMADVALEPEFVDPKQ